MAGQLLNTLEGSGTKPAASHEARLGIMVITILVFAFGFLVYHKMDMHQRQLTQASIARNGSVKTEVASDELPAGLMGPTLVAATDDPMINIADLSGGSPFFEPAKAASDSTPEVASIEQSFAALEEPSSPMVAAISDEPVQLEQPGAADELLIATSEPSPPQDNFFPDRGVPQQETSLQTAVVESAIKIDNSFLSSNSLSDASNETPATSSTAVEERTSVASSVADDSFNLSVSAPAFEPVETAENSVEEPVLLAMAEPQQADGFGDGFLLDDSTDSQPSRPAVEDPAEFSGLSTSESNSQPEVSQQRQAAESRGFNAVKNPGGKKDGRTIRTAAGSGSDGKFSLAAFNYQNGATQAAPDDGSTFNSVVVQNGDNYTKISKRVYGSVKYFSALAVFNQHRISEPKNMRPGMVVLVPAKEVLEERYPELFVDSQSKVAEVAEFFLLEDGSPAYRVGERETISQISERFLGRSSRWIEIYRLNQSVLKDPNKLKAGLILALPADATEVNVAQ